MLERRDEEKRRREEAAINASHLSDGANDESPDEYAIMLRAAQTRGDVADKDLSRGVSMKSNLPSLVEISIKILADNFEEVACLDGVPPKIRGIIAMELSRRRKLTTEALKLILSEESDSIIVPECSLIDDQTLLDCLQRALIPRYDAAQECVNLRLVELHNCGRCFSDKIAKYMTPLSSDLDVLILKGCFRVSDEALSDLLRAAQRIRVLDLSCILRLGEKALAAIGVLSHLESLALDDVAHIADADIVTLFPDRRDSIKSISLSRLVRLTDVGLFHLINSCPNLTEVTVDGCNSITDAFIELLMNGNKRLTSVDFSNMPKLSTPALMDFFNISSSISGHARHEFERVTLKNLDAVTDSVIISICSNSAIKLKRLEIAGCRNITGKGAMAIIKHNSASLEELDISFVRKIPEYAVLQLIDECSRLKTLHVWGCTQLTRVFAKRCLELNLNINGYFDKYD
jgi:hypothetical protein